MDKRPSKILSRSFSIFFLALLLLGGLSLITSAQTDLGQDMSIQSNLTVPDGHMGIGDDPNSNWQFSVVGSNGNRFLSTHNNGHGAFISSTGGNYILRLHNDNTGVDSFNFNANGSMIAQGDVRAPIFYDSQNTNYYINPSSSNISAMFNGSVGVGASSNPNSVRRLDIRGSGNQSVWIESTTEHRAGLFLGSPTTGGLWEIESYHDGNFRFQEDGIGSWLYLNKTNGWVSLTGDPADQRRLQLPNISNSNGRAIANQWNTYSSQRYKENITPLSTEEAIEKIMNLNPVSFNWKEEYGGSYDIGFIAEEVGTIIPEAVEWDEDGEYADDLNVNIVIPYLTNLIQNQEIKLKELEDRLMSLKDRSL